MRSYLSPLVLCALALLCAAATERSRAAAELPDEHDLVATGADLSAYQRSTLTRLDPRDRTYANAMRLVRMSLAENTRPLRPERCDPECPPGVSAARDGTAGAPTEDHPAILQVAENKRRELEHRWRRPVRLREAMELLAPHVVGKRRLKRQRQVWIRNLPARGAAFPSGFPKPNIWQEHYAKNYQRFRSWAIRAVTMGYWPVCDGTPIAYGGSIDVPIAVARGLCIDTSCGDRDTFWARPGQGCSLDEPATADAYARVEQHARNRRRHLENRTTIPAVAAGDAIQ